MNGSCAGMARPVVGHLFVLSPFPTSKTSFIVWQVLIPNITGDMLSDVLDTIVSSGGDDVTIDSFTLSASTDLISEATNDARQAAVEDAEAVAELLSAAAGVVLGRPVQIQDTNAAPRTANFEPAAGKRKAVL